MNRKSLLFAALLVASLASSSASAITFELLYSPCWTGDPNNIDQDNGVMGMYRGSIDCFNKDFNGGGARTILSFKHFQPWEFGSMFLYYDITGPFNGAFNNAWTANEKGGFFGGITFALSAKKIAQKITGKEYNWGFLYDVSLKYEMEHVAKYGMIHYYGLSYDLAVPFMDFVSAQTVIRNDATFEGVDLQLGLAWQKSFTLLTQDFVFDGFIAYGVFGEGASRIFPGRGIWFIVAQPQFMWDVGKLVTFTPGKFYLGLEYQIALNRYLIEGKTENVLSGMIHWNL